MIRYLPMIRYLLDTDHLSLQQRGIPQLLSRLKQIPPDEIAISVITVEEQFRGRLAQIRGARSVAELLPAYLQLRQTLALLGPFNVVDFDAQAQQAFDQLKPYKLKIGTQDIRIAAIALSRGLTLVTRNQRHFAQVANLIWEDWSK